MMKTKSKKYQKWLTTAYKEFACNGPDFSLNALAAKAKLPRATLYYHFDDKEHLLAELVKHHKSIIEVYHNDISNNVKVLIPDLYKVMFKYKDALLFHYQLLKNCHIKQFCELYRGSNERSLIILLPLIKEQFYSDKSDREIIQFYHTLTDTWYTRLDVNNLSVESMVALAMEILESTLGLYQGNKVLCN
ncbi:TetR/AcrR family transcriptional regulator [Carboxylicivirga linearis]|nr:TetR/AcrR family transcriptional regulator [Carboxylicivirga linearis]